MNLIDIDPKEYVPVLGLLKQIDFLKDVSEAELKNILFSLQKTTVGPNKTILFQGEIANCLYIIRQGTATITTKNKGEKITLAELQVGSYFGEISLLTPSSATATATAGEKGTDLIIITHEAMTAIARKIPDFKERLKKVIDVRIASKKMAKEANDAGPAPK